MSSEDKYALNDSGIGQIPEAVDARTVWDDSLGRADNSGIVADICHNTNGFLQRIRLEAQRVVDDARKEVDSLKTEAESELRREFASLEKRAAELEKARKTLESDLNEWEQRRNALEKETFEKAKNDGYDQGFAAGKEEGIKRGEKKVGEQLEARVAEAVASRVQETSEAALEPLRKLALEMRGARQALLKNWEENIMQIAAAIAYQTILREPAIMREAPVELLREALELAMNCASLKIRMNPNDVKALQEQIRIVLEETGNLAKSEVVADPKITRGGCLVETSLGVVDERLESRLERIVAELSE
ncbi:MAG: hypothetical protein J6X44_02795 [Thermoguttaceae bacterium]|nr:hypothetical protein [Thermoguttaceae bacterium]